MSVRFEPDGDETTVEVVHVEGPRPLPDWAQTVRLFDRAWAHVIAAFADSLTDTRTAPSEDP